MQEHILDRHRGQALTVHAVWYAMYPGDARPKWRGEILDDARVVHWWDDKRVVGRRLLRDVRQMSARRASGSREFEGDILWDAYLLFDGTARWAQAPTGLVKWGYPILPAREALIQTFTTLVKQRPKPARSLEPVRRQLSPPTHLQ